MEENFLEGEHNCECCGKKVNRTFSIDVAYADNESTFYVCENCHKHPHQTRQVLQIMLAEIEESEAM